MKNTHLLTYFILLFLSFAGLTSCAGIKVNCPDFNEEILCWLPYQKNDEIEFYSKLNDLTLKFSINSVIVMHTTDYATGTDCGGCSDQILINQSPHDDPNFRIFISLNKNKIISQTYQIGDTYFLNGNYTYSEKKNYLFEGKEYDIVRIFEKTDSKGKFKKLIIAKNIGIIGLIDNDDNTWILKPDAEIKRFDANERERGGIVINNVSC